MSTDGARLPSLPVAPQSIGSNPIRSEVSRLDKHKVLKSREYLGRAWAVRSSSNQRDALRLEERRKEARFKLILRVGLLEQAGKSCLCLVKNISSAGLQLKLYTSLIVDAEASLRLADEQSVHGRIAWVKDDIAGMSFFEELHATALLRVQQKLVPHRRRTTPRVSIEASATLRSGGGTFRATVFDISSSGARVRSSSPVKTGDRAIIQLSDLPPINAYVRWNDAGECGLAFETPIPIQILAQWVEGRVPLSV